MADPVTMLRHHLSCAPRFGGYAFSEDSKSRVSMPIAQLEAARTLLACMDGPHDPFHLQVIEHTVSEVALLLDDAQEVRSAWAAAQGIVSEGRSYAAALGDRLPRLVETEPGVCSAMAALAVWLIGALATLDKAAAKAEELLGRLDQLLTVEQFARRMKVTPDTIYRLCRRKPPLKHIRIGSTIRLDFEEAMRSMEVRAEDSPSTARAKQSNRRFSNDSQGTIPGTGTKRF